MRKAGEKKQILVMKCHLVKVFVFLFCTSFAQGLKTSNEPSYSFKDTSTVTDSPVKNATEIPSSDILHRCNAYVHAFGLAASSYMNCAIMNSRPFNFCLNCAKEHWLAMSHYKSIETGKVFDDGDPSKKCREIILSADRIMIVTQAADFVQKSWQDSNCDNCFDITNGCKDLGNCSVANRTLVFQDYYHHATDCLNNYTDYPIHEGHKTNRSEAGCKECANMYNRLNKFYVKMETEYEGKLCMDIVDAMNYTRQTWSKDLGCASPHGDMAAIICMSSFFCMLPIVFYTASKLHGEREEKKLLKQKRMKTIASSQDSSASSAGLGVNT